MTLSNFDWTDKDSVKWFIMLPTGHEGPYALKALEKSFNERRLASDVMIWSEGLQSPLKLKDVLNHGPSLDDLPPPLPPIPTEEEQAFGETTEDAPPEFKAKLPAKFPAKLVALLLGLGLSIYLFKEYLKGQEEFRIHRHSRMTLEIHKKIQDEFSFEGWDKKIFLKEYVPSDLSHVWLITSGFQKCQIEASFRSLPGKILSMKEEKVAFKSHAKLKGHVAEFSSFDFSAGNKILPGMYEVDIHARECEWDGLLPKLGNFFESPEGEYVARQKVVLFSKGAEAFNQILNGLVKKKADLSLREKNRSELFWQDLQQKLQTLLAISLQIEQLMMDFFDKDEKKYSQNLPVMVNQYTRKFGHFLTNFVVSNEKYFNGLNDADVSGISTKRNYELMVKLTSKKLGFESMKIIEELQSKKSMKRADLEKNRLRVNKMFSQLKEEINQKIIQISEDRSK